MSTHGLAALVSLVVLTCSTVAVAQRSVPVSDAGELTAALDDAMAGDDIVLANGTYPMGDRVSTRAGGTAAMPIRVRAASAGRATIRFGTGGGVTEGFLVQHPYWTFEDLRIEGVCGNDSNCEHAWHVVGAADFTIIRNNVALGFNAQIKGNGNGSPREFPDDVLIEGNEFYSPAVRMTGNPVTPIDVVGGRRWIIRANFIHDFAKGMGNGISYAAFLKGNSRDGIIEQNLIVCELMHTGRTRLGLSFGGGGSNPDSICEGGSCAIEHQNGIMRNNIIVHCPTDVGIYINECSSCEIVHNTLFDSTGIDLRFGPTNAIVAGNLISGRIRDRDGASSTRSNNLEMVSNANFNAWFADPDVYDFGLTDGSSFVDVGATLASVRNDFCSNTRDDGSPDIGAVEYDGDGPCDTTQTHLGSGPIMGTDAGPPDLDAGAGDDGGMMGTDSGSPGTDSGSPGTDSGSPGTDSGSPGTDAGMTGTSDGCDCSAVAGVRERGHAGELSFALLALVWLVRRRNG